jgi:hypothetical protein
MSFRFPNWSRWLARGNTRRRVSSCSRRMDLIENLEDRRLLSAQTILPVAAETRIESRRMKAATSELDGGFIIQPRQPGEPPNPLGNLDFISIIVKGKKVSVAVFEDSDPDNHPSYLFKAKSLEIPAQGLQLEGKGKVLKNVQFFLDAPTFNQETQETHLTGSFIINGEVFSIHAVKED